MSECYQQPPLYNAYFSLAQTPTTITIIVLCVSIPFLLLLLIAICKYHRHRRNKIMIEPIQNADKKDRNVQKQVKRERDWEIEPHHYEEGPDVRPIARNTSRKITKVSGQPQQQSFVSRLDTFLSQSASTKKLVALLILTLLLLVTALIFLILSALATEQALSHNFPYAECTLKSKVKNFVDGDSQWMGLSYMVPNLTKLQLNLNTRIAATRNSINTLLKNGSGASNPIGFPNMTRIPYSYAYSSGVESFINLALRQWLNWNSTLSTPGYNFTICQSTPTLIPHPLNSGQTIQLNYMDSICQNLTNEVDNLVANGKAIDDMLTLSTSIQSNRVLYNSNLSKFNDSISSIALRSNQYTQQFSSTGIDTVGQHALPYILLGLGTLMIVISMGYLGWHMCKIGKYEKEGNNERERERQQVKRREIMNVSITENSSMDESDIQARRQAKIKQMLRTGFLTSSKSTHIVNAVIFLILCAIGLSSISYLSSIQKSLSSCETLSLLNSGASLPANLQASQQQLLSPLQKCLSNSVGGSTSNGEDRFLETGDSSVFMGSMNKLNEVWKLYNASTPTSVFNSTSVQQVQILKQYLLHMQTMPIKSQTFNLLSIVQELNNYTNGSAATSSQISECQKSVLKDQYVYNVADCNFNLIDYTSEVLVGDSRCLQIPTYDASGGSNLADLNNAQTTIELNTTCPKVTDFYDGANPACFLGKRMGVLVSAGCSSTAAEYSRRLSNLIKFSLVAASYTNSYLQNLRNYIGVYFALSSNITQFFNGANNTQILTEFGSLTNNFINKIPCSYVRSSIQEVYDNYCPENNNVGVLMYDAYAWNFIAFGIGVLGWIGLIVWQILARGHVRKVAESNWGNDKMEIQQKVINDDKGKKKVHRRIRLEHIEPQKSTLKRLEISQQTLRNEDDDDPIQPLQSLVWQNSFDKKIQKKQKRQEIIKQEVQNSRIQEEKAEIIEQPVQIVGNNRQNYEYEAEQQDDKSKVIKIAGQMKAKDFSQVDLSLENTQKLAENYGSMQIYETAKKQEVNSSQEQSQKIQISETKVQKQASEELLQQASSMYESGKKNLNNQVDGEKDSDIEHQEAPSPKRYKLVENSRYEHQDPVKSMEGQKLKGEWSQPKIGESFNQTHRNETKKRNQVKLADGQQGTFAFFGNIANKLIESNDKDSQNNSSHGSEQKRKAQSKMQIRGGYKQKKQKQMSNVMKMAKQGKEAERIKIVQLDEMIKNNADSPQKTKKQSKM